MPAGPSQFYTYNAFNKTPSDINLDETESMIDNDDFPGLYYKIYGTYNVKNSFTTVLSTYVYFEIPKNSDDYVSNGKRVVPDWNKIKYCRPISPESNYNFTSYTDLTEIRKRI